MYVIRDKRAKSVKNINTYVLGLQRGTKSQRNKANKKRMESQNKKTPKIMYIEHSYLHIIDEWV